MGAYDALCDIEPITAPIPEQISTERDSMLSFLKRDRSDFIHAMAFGRSYPLSRRGAEDDGDELISEHSRATGDETGSDGEEELATGLGGEVDGHGVGSWLC